MVQKANLPKEDQRLAKNMLDEVLIEEIFCGACKLVQLEIDDDASNDV